jgi:hypothetical protein
MDVDAAATPEWAVKGGMTGARSRNSATLRMMLGTANAAAARMRLA